MLKTFQQSGRYSHLLFATTLGAMLPAVALAFVYQTLIWWVPVFGCVPLLWIYLGIVCVCLYLLTRLTVHLGKCRNAAATVVVGLILASTTLVASHWFHYTQNRSVFSKTLSEHALAEGFLTLRSLGVDDPEIANEPVSAKYFAGIYTFGTHFKVSVENGWEFRLRSKKYGSGNPDSGTPVNLKGPIVYILWAVEAWLMIIAGAVGGLNTSREPYDETADQWMEASEIYSVASTPADSRRVTHAKTVDELTDGTSKLERGDLRIVYYLANPQNASEPSYLKVDVETTIYDEGAKPRVHTTTGLKWVRLDPDDVIRLRESIAKAHEAAYVPPPLTPSNQAAV